MRRILLPLLLLVLACAKPEQPAASSAPVEAPRPAATATAAAIPNGSTNEPSLISFSAGALIAQKAQEYDDTWSTFWLIDGRPQSGWASPENVVTPQTAVIALPERTLLDRLAFDTGSTDGERRGAKDVVVEMSDTSATDGFQQIAAVALQDKRDDQTFPVTAQIPGRWVRVTVKNNHGSTEYLELMDVRGYGRQLTQTPFPNASGTYETNYGKFHLRQEGTSVTGCYEHGEGLLNGGIEGRVMHFTWRESGGPDDNGPAMMVFSPDGKQLFGLWWNGGQEDKTGSVWNGTKISDEVGSCPHWSGGAESALTKELEQFGRTRVYGINFDLDSARIRDESKPTLDKIVAILKAKDGWTLKIEGHTDSTGGDARNQQLSQQRAEAVVQYLVTNGIAASRLSASGFGASHPVAPNTTESGRAQNRRVELVKE